jgi:hypothetical protein
MHSLDSYMAEERRKLAPEWAALAEAEAMHVAHTGGGCLTLERVEPSGCYVWLTGMDGASLPEQPDDWIVGAYDPGGDCEGLACLTPADGVTVAEALKRAREACDAFAAGKGAR